MRKQLIDDLNTAILNGELPPQCEEAVDWLERHTNLQAAKPAEGSLPVVAWLRTSGTGSPVLTAEFLKSFPSHKHCFERPLVELSMATAEINNLKAEIDKRDWCVAEKMAELTRLRAQMEGVVGALRNLVASVDGGCGGAVDDAKEALATYQSTQGDKN